MSPRTALRILLFLSFFLFVFIFAMYKIQLQYSSMTLKDLAHQTEMEKKISEAEAIMGISEEVRTLQEKSDEMIREDLKMYNNVRPETVQKITEMANRQIRIKNGLPVE